MALDQRLEVPLRCSRLAALALLIAVTLSGALAARLPLPAWLAGVVVLAIGAWGLWQARCWALRSSPRAIVAIMLDREHRIQVIDRSGRRVEGMLLSSAYVGARLTTVVWRPAGSRRTCALALLPDMLDAEDFRRLRVLMRVGGARARGASPMPHAGSGDDVAGTQTDNRRE